jgi:predicted  nucleic acid-binding Zn-ribbon protein
LGDLQLNSVESQLSEATSSYYAAKHSLTEATATLEAIQWEVDNFKEQAEDLVRVVRAKHAKPCKYLVSISNYSSAYNSNGMPGQRVWIVSLTKDV